MVGVEICGKPFQQVDDFPRLLRGVGLQRVQPFPVLGQPHRHTGDGLHPGIQRSQLPESALQGGAVIDAGAEDALAVDGNAPLRQLPQIVQLFPGKPVAHHLAAQLRVGGVHRHVDWADVHF